MSRPAAERRVRRGVAPPHRAASAAAVASGVCLALAFTAFRPPPGIGPLERDFEAYYAGGATANAGEDPYSRAVWAAERRVPGVDRSREELLPFVGPAAGLPLWTLLARLAYLPALALWTTLLAAALAAIVAAALRIAGTSRRPRRVALCLVLAIASAPLISSLALGQAALVSAGAIAAALVAYRARRVAGAFAATLLAALQPNLTLALLARMRSRWDAGVAVAAAAAFAGLTLAAGGGPGGFVAYATHLRAQRDAESDIAIQHTPGAIADALGVAPHAALDLAALIAVATVALTVVLIRRERLDPTDATLLASAALPLSMPFFHEQDFALAVLPVAVLALRSRGLARGLAAVAAVLVLIDWFGIAQRHFAAGQIVALGFAVAFAFAGLGPPTVPHDELTAPPRRRRADPAKGRGRTVLHRGAGFAGVVTLAALAAVAVPLGRAHPAPNWPDALPAHYRAPAGADASVVWRDEQRSAGLARRDPVWGLLRMLPLAGCVLLGAALIADARARRRGTLPRRRALRSPVEPAPATVTPAICIEDRLSRSAKRQA